MFIQPKTILKKVHYLISQIILIICLPFSILLTIMFKLLHSILESIDNGKSGIAYL